MSSILSTRNMNTDDQRFVASSWFESYWKCVVQHTKIPFDEYRRGQDERIRRLMARSRVRVVYATAIPDEIIGYAVMEPEEFVAHWVYVKSAYRREGVAQALLKHDYRWYTHASGKAGTKLTEKLGLIYNPYLLER